MHLKKSLGLWDSSSLMFSAMVGTGIFFSTGHILTASPNSWIVLLAWVFGGLIAYSGAVSYGFLARIYPVAGGEYIYLKEAYHPSLAFISGWTSLLITFSASVSVLGLAIHSYLIGILPWIPSWEIYSFPILGMEIHFGSPQLTGILCIFFFSLTNHFGMVSGIRVQNFITVIKLFGLFAFIFFGFLSWNWEISNLGNLPDFSFDSGASLILATVTVTYSYLGWNMITYVAEEIQDPNRNIGRAILISCVFVTLLYFGLNFLFLTSVPASNLVGQDEIVMISANSLWGANSIPWIAGFTIWIMLGSMSAILIGGSRIYIAMARDGLFFRSFADLHPKYKSPYKSIWFQFLYACLFLTIQDIESLLYIITFTIIILTVIISTIPIYYRIRGIGRDIHLPLFPYTPILFIILNCILAYELFVTKMDSAIWGLMITLSGIPFYLVFRYLNGKRKA
ncbi:APC family permease [Leptospira sp. GIMC2001]|uniref:APC family permease n=1 Tax=Leptospira sp. GIMC2001 TaxID=1513297 RepID=UPI00234A2DAD|nr:amino acid permease [Leptospira sp. GIMC2001]WCL48506.1 amino acid permease [Leptospira sp. GIMC2001]